MEAIVIKIYEHFLARHRESAGGNPRDPKWRRFAKRWLPRTLTGQVLLIAVTVVVLLLAAGGAALVTQFRQDKEQDAWGRARAEAAAFANSPGMAQAMRSPNPAAILQPLVESAADQGGVDFIVVEDSKGRRYTQPDSKAIAGRLSSAFPPRKGLLSGNDPCQNLGGDCAVVAVLDGEKKVVGSVLVGASAEKVTGSVDRMPLGELGSGAAIAMGGVALISRRLRRQTSGVAHTQLTGLGEIHDVEPHSVREGDFIIDGDGRIRLTNDEACDQISPSTVAEGRSFSVLGLDQGFTELADSGPIAVGGVPPAGGRSTLRDTADSHAPTGRADTAREPLKLTCGASTCAGSALDLTRTAEELATVATRRFADFITVDLSNAVLQGEEPIGDDPELRRAAAAGAGGHFPLYPAGEVLRFSSSTPQAVCFTRGESVLEPVLAQASGSWKQGPDCSGKILEAGIHSLITVPVRVRGACIGVASFYRSKHSDSFDEEDLSAAEDIMSRGIDNAWRLTREHSMAESLQRSLLPSDLDGYSAVDVAYRYLPSPAGAGGDWFDVIPLSGARVALVVGDVVGHGPHAAATMGRLRTAVHNFSALDLAPDELLAHLDTLVSRLDQEVDTSRDCGVTGATCLYAVYDPATRICTMSNAGHPPLALVQSDGHVSLQSPSPAPLLGAGGHPFELLELEVPEGSQLVLYTDGLLDDHEHDWEKGTIRLSEALAARPGRSPEETCNAALGVLPTRTTDDVALLVARTKALDDQHVAVWDVAADPAIVADIRAAVVEKLTQWGLEEAAFATELIISELVSNAIRYGRDPIHVRLLQDRTLICEVSDASSTSPHLRRAAITDENGRGLFLVAQLTERWGTRYTARGKTIWAEQHLPT